ncbi:hypothetical protein PRIPAC_97530, partial [Pristionchus pacificus]|uniref:Uncharacterized protein n=1 Tax=Pristionchus pacificus TaxID=54126 RepID=A0A2A6CUA3_PRIPA
YLSATLIALFRDGDDQSKINQHLEIHHAFNTRTVIRRPKEGMSYRAKGEPSFPCVDSFNVLTV